MTLGTEITDLISIDNLTVKTRERKSAFISPFWGDNEKPAGVLCFPFYELKWSNGCLYKCDYCYLKGTFKWGIDKTPAGKDEKGKAKPWIGSEQVVFSNLDAMYAEVEALLKNPVLKPTVVHTGEVSDSLAVPGSEKVMAKLIEMFATQDRHTLLLLTKSNNVDALLNLKHNNRTVIAFSINCNAVAREYEKGAAEPYQRIDAAEACINAGYKVMVRVDPMIPVADWQEKYYHLFIELNRLTELGLYGVVVGTLRAFPQLRPKMSKELQDMLTVRDVDKRWHIDHKLRDEMYDLAFSTLKSKRIGVCKESGEMWGKLIQKHGSRDFICNCHL